MAQILRFSSPAMRERASVLQEMRALAVALGMTWEYFTECACGEGKTWDDRPLDFLYGPLNLLRAELTEQKRKAAPTAPAKTPAPPAAKAAAHRRDMITKVHIALPILYAKLPRFNEETYRHILSERWGADSSTKLNNTQLHELLLHLADLGRGVLRGKIRRGGPDDIPATLKRDTSGLGRTGLMRKIEAMLAEKGRVEGTDMPWGYAAAILKRQTGGAVSRFEDATPEHLRGVIAALYRDANRKDRRTR